VTPPDAGRISRRFVKLGSLFGIGVAVGLSPLLGNADVPGFRALLGLFPIGVATTLIPTSAFLMGLAALGTYAVVLTQNLSRTILARTLGASVVVAALLLAILVIVYGLVVAQVPYDGGAKVAPFVVGTIRLPNCRCTDSSDVQCIEELSFKLSAVESCWGTRAVAMNRIALELLYLGLLAAFGTSIGSAVAFEENAKRSQKGKVRRG
jgi:hypothetical protein